LTSMSLKMSCADLIVLNTTWKDLVITPLSLKPFGRGFGASVLCRYTT
jgi:hypothetical protein